MERTAAAEAPSLLRRMNQRLLLDRLFAHGAAIRPQLARDSGLSLPTVIAALRDLEDAGLVRPAGRHEPEHGRPAAAYRANAAAGSVLGADRPGEAARAHRGSRGAAARRAARVAQPRADRGRAGGPGRVHRRPGHGAGGHRHGGGDAHRGRLARRARSGSRPDPLRAEPARLAAPRPRRDPGRAPRRRVTIDNDANLAALGEHAYDAARGLRNFVCLGGGIGQHLDLLDAHVTDALAAITPLRPRLAVGALGAEAALRGAIATGVAAARECVFAVYAKE